MTLAAIFVISIFYASSPAAVATAQVATQAPPTTQESQSVPAQNPPTPSQTTPAATPAKTPAGKTPTNPAKRARQKKRVLPPNCDNASAAPGNTSSSAPEGPASASAAPSSDAVANCPPSKVIVRQGGTTEPSIQLAGGASGDQTSHQRDTANQMLEATETNLKKVAGQQLAANQQDMVNQIHQFIGQSKTAAEAGDLERAQNLAWKAKLLSDELVKPAK